MSTDPKLTAVIYLIYFDLQPIYGSGYSVNLMSAIGTNLPLYSIIFHTFKLTSQI